MNVVKWALGLGVGAVVLSKVFSSSSGSVPLVKVPPKDTTPPPAVTRFEVKRDVIPLGTELSLTTFTPGDSLNIMMLDHDKNTEFPGVVKVKTVAVDGLDTEIFTGSFPTKDQPENGTHFVVYPRDVLLRTPAIVIPPPAPPPAATTHRLDAGDVAFGPKAFALLAGYGNVDEFIAHNAGILADTIPRDSFGNPSLTTADLSTPGVYFSTDLIGHLVSPWVAGTIVNVKKAIAIPPAGSPPSPPLGAPPGSLPKPPPK